MTLDEYFTTVLLACGPPRVLEKNHYDQKNRYVACVREFIRCNPTPALDDTNTYFAYRRYHAWLRAEMKLTTVVKGFSDDPR